MQPVSHPTDEDLLRLLRGGNEEAFTTLYRRWSSRIYRFACQMSGSPQIAEEITQDTFMTLLQNLRTFDTARGSLLSFLYGVSRNLLRRQFEREEDMELVTTYEGVAEELTAGAGLFEELARRENIEAVRQAVLSLPPTYREALVLCDLQELNYEQAAMALSCPIGTVRSRLHRGRAMLYAKLQNRCCV
jgi:RNA polymerase sigma-70 factor (ECF subfamily)